MKETEIKGLTLAGGSTGRSFYWWLSPKMRVTEFTCPPLLRGVQTRTFTASGHGLDVQVYEGKVISRK